MSRTLSVRNHQRDHAVRARLLHSIALWALEGPFARTEYKLEVQLVGQELMARVNAGYLCHQGSTDVITFDYREVPKRDRKKRTRRSLELELAGLPLHGEILICPADAVKHAREFRTTWQSEVVRYLLHGLLHLHGFDDHSAMDRRRMKREEDRLLELAAGKFKFQKLAAS